MFIHSKSPECVLDGWKDLDEWPKKTDVCCWWCCHKFDTTPLPSTTGYDSRTKMFRFQGIFCSWSCCKAHLLTGGKDWARNCMFLLALRRKVEGKTLPIIPAPPRQLLKMFGGSMDIEEFRKKGDSGTSVEILEHPKSLETSRVVEITTMPNKPSRKISKALSELITQSESKAENLRLKREPKVQSNQSNLLQQMKITVS